MENKYFTSELITERIIRITEISGVMMYLVIGDKKAALLDSGVGMKGLKEFVKSLTDKEVITILTHGHIDHIAGACAFPEVYLNALDYELASQHLVKGKQLEHMIMSGNGQMLNEELAFIPLSTPKYKDLSVGDVFDLGGVTLEICEGAGHTKGQITILIPEEKTLLLGDACNDFIFMFLPEAGEIMAYREMLVRLNNTVQNRFERIIISHGTGWVPGNIMNEVIAVCDEIIAGTSDDIPFEALGEKGFIAKARNVNGERIDGKVGNIVYKK